MDCIGASQEEEECFDGLKAGVFDSVLERGKLLSRDELDVTPPRRVYTLILARISLETLMNCST